MNILDPIRVAFRKRRLIRSLTSFLGRYFLLVGLLIALTYSFFYGWYIDTSKPVSGSGWQDQIEYSGALSRIKDGELPTERQMRYPIGYIALGVVGSFFVPSDPFMPVSLVLLLASATLCYIGATQLFGRWFALAFTALLFYWDGIARSFNYASELFAVPWNNQMLFFAVAFYFWLLITRVAKQPSYKLVVVSGLVSGLCFISREETVLFIIPALTAFLFLSKAPWKKWLLAYGLIVLCFVPQVAVKFAVNGGSLDTNRRFTYQQTFGQYMQPYLLKRNIWETVLVSDHYGRKLLEHPSGDPLFRRGGPKANRQTILEASPWLWISPLGVAAILFLRRYSMGLKVFVVISGFILLFYMSGVNLSGQKLKFHALRYVTPGYIMLNLATVVAIREAIFVLPAGIMTSRRLSKVRANNVE
jgi:hypothetical protein